MGTVLKFRHRKAGNATLSSMVSASRKEYRKNERERWTLAGLCSQCGAERDSLARQTCAKCRSRRKTYNRTIISKSKSRGMCIKCHQKEPQAGLTTCVDCYNGALKRGRGIYHTRKAQGLCPKCGEARDSEAITCSTCRKIQRDKQVARWDAIFAYYGQLCICCGETERAFLTVDHVNGDGADWRNTGKANLQALVIAEGFPEKYQVLCWNCNCAKGMRGGCPHQKQAKAA